MLNIMKKQSLLFIFALLFFVPLLKAQIGKEKVRVTASDSTVFKMDFVEYEGDDMYKNYIFANLGGNDLGEILQAGYTRYQPDMFIATGEVGAFVTSTEYNVGGIYFLLNSKMGSHLRYRFVATDNDNSSKIYKLKTNGISNVHFGFHGQAGYRKQLLTYNPPIIVGDTFYNMDSYSSGRISAGLGLVATSNGLIYVGNNSIYTGTGSMITAFADVIYYPAQRITYTKELRGYYPVDLEPSGLSPKDVTNGQFGFELRLIGQHQFHFQKEKIPRANFGFRWQAGLMRKNYTGPNLIPTFGKYATTFTVGLYLAFGE